MMYHFVAVLDQDDFSEVDTERLAECGCLDGTVSRRKGVVSIGFDRESSGLEAAIASAMADVRRAGMEVVRVELDTETLNTLAAAG